MLHGSLVRMGFKLATAVVWSMRLLQGINLFNTACVTNQVCVAVCGNASFIFQPYIGQDYIYVSCQDILGPLLSVKELRELGVAFTLLETPFLMLQLFTLAFLLMKTSRESVKTSQATCMGAITTTSSSYP